MKTRRRICLLLVSVAVLFAATNMANALTDDGQTLALWHFDSTYTGSAYGEPREVVADDDQFNPGRGMDLIGGRRAAGYPGTEPTLVSGGVSGSAWSFDGDDHAYVNSIWTNTDAFKIELAFKPVNVTDVQSLVAVTQVFEIRFNFNSSKTHGKIDFVVYDDALSAKTAYSLYAPINAMTSQWNHVIAMVDADGNVTVELVEATAGAAVDATVTGVHDAHHTTVYVGAAYAYSRPFTGLIDEIKISDLTKVPPAHLNPYVDDKDTRLLLHCDEILEVGPRRTPDDDSFATRSDNMDGILNPASSPDDDYYGPALVSSFGDDPNEGFEKCFEFTTGFQYIKVQGDSETDTLGIQSDNFRIEFYAKMPTKANDGYSTYLVHQPGPFRINIDDRASDWLVRFVTWGPSGAVVVVLDLVVTEPLDQWTHYAFEFYQGEMTTYINGVQKAQRTAAYTSVSAPLKPLFIGAAYLGYHPFFGLIDEIRISDAVPAPAVCGDWGYLTGDISGPAGEPDCYVDIHDLKALASEWLLDCTAPGNPECQF